nr:unnamed protein product [Callosobruchus analis]
MCPVNLEKVPSTITCCMVLHNIAKYLGSADFEYIAEPGDNYHNGGDYGVEDGCLQRARERLLQNNFFIASFVLVKLISYSRFSGVYFFH